MRLYLQKVLSLLIAMLVFFCIFPLPAFAAERLQEISDPPVIVIDPGHGGENLGTKVGSQEEKYMTMTTALAMYEELKQYDDVEVYLTRTEDVDVSIKARAEFAKSVNADFVFSIHYNASENHTLFGAEIWIPQDAPYNGYGYQFGYEFLKPLQERGLFIRGIKTRKGEKGLDYYGIIRETAAMGIPAVILEHCHVDEARDIPFCDSEEDLKLFGREDATAVAKYFGLKSSKLNVDYSEYQLVKASNTKAEQITLADETPPDVCILEFAEADYEKGKISFLVSAADYDTPLIYYDFSIDGGITYSSLAVWPESDVLTGTYQDTFKLNLEIPDGVKPTVIVRAYNLYGGTTESNSYESPKTFQPPVNRASEEQTHNQEEALSHTETADEAANQESQASVAAVSENVKTEQEISFITFLKLCLGVVAGIFCILLFSQIASSYKKKANKKKRQKTYPRKPSGENRNQHR